jgi:phosphogluconate dehydratase
VLKDGTLAWRSGPQQSHDPTVLAPMTAPFSAHGGLKLLTGNLGRAVIKVSAVKPERWVIEAPAVIFNDQDELQAAFKRGELARDFVAVVRFQGPKANGMPELHKLTPALGVLMDKGFKVALLTDGRMSGASGKVPAAIHLTPEAADGGPIAKLRDGDIIRIDATSGRLEALVSAAEWLARTPATSDLSRYGSGLGRELFAGFRASVGAADTGATVLGFLPDR